MDCEIGCAMPTCQSLLFARRAARGTRNNCGVVATRLMNLQRLSAMAMYALARRVLGNRILPAAMRTGNDESSGHYFQATKGCEELAKSAQVIRFSDPSLLWR